MWVRSEARARCDESKSQKPDAQTATFLVLSLAGLVGVRAVGFCGQLELSSAPFPDARREQRVWTSWTVVSWRVAAGSRRRGGRALAGVRCRFAPLRAGLGAGLPLAAAGCRCWRRRLPRLARLLPWLMRLQLAGSLGRCQYARHQAAHSAAFHTLLIVPSVATAHHVHNHTICSIHSFACLYQRLMLAQRPELRKEPPNETLRAIAPP